VLLEGIPDEALRSFVRRRESNNSGWGELVFKAARHGEDMAEKTVQLRFLAHARSGDKGDTANVGLIALEAEYYPVLQREVTVSTVARHFKGMVSGVERFELPNLNALNFLLHGALDGGGTISLKTDAQGKVYSTALLRMEIPVPPALARKVAAATKTRKKR
jgi:hypothetical protein